ncbi:hypothetical protein D3C87_1337720 [compost metagenome]
MRDAIADAANQFAQALGHALNGTLQLTQFVLAYGGQVVGQVAGGNALGHFKSLVQRDHDLPGDGPCGE